MGRFLKVKRGWAEHLSTVLEWGERLILGIGAIVLLLWLIDPVRDWLKANQLMDIERVVALCALAIIFSLRSPPRTNDGRRELHILGISLFSAWNHLQPLLSKKTFCDWDVTFACMSPDFAQAEPAIPADWAEELPGRIRAISDFIKREKDVLDKRNVKVRLFLFAHLPAIHGFRIERDEIFCSYIQWEGATLAKPFQFYEHFAASNRSARASQYRDLFANWLERSHASAPVASN